MMVKRRIKYALTIVIGAFLVYQSVYFKSLSAVKAASQQFNAGNYAENYLFKTIPQAKDKLTDMAQLLDALQSDPEKAFNDFSYAPSEGNVRYFMANGAGTVIDKGDEEVWLKDLEGRTIKLAAQYIYGTAARDGAGLIAVDSFDNTMAFNTVSEKINQLIKTRIVPKLQETLIGDTLSYTGALELNRTNPKLTEVAVIPLQIKRLSKKRN